MVDLRDKPKRMPRLMRAVVEVGFIMFLFYANLLMGEFTFTNERGKTLRWAVNDILTWRNFIIALIAATIGYLVFEVLRRNLDRHE